MHDCLFVCLLPSANIISTATVTTLLATHPGFCFLFVLGFLSFRDTSICFWQLRLHNVSLCLLFYCVCDCVRLPNIPYSFYFSVLFVCFHLYIVCWLWTTKHNNTQQRYIYSIASMHPCAMRAFLRVVTYARLFPVPWFAARPLTLQPCPTFVPPVVARHIQPSLALPPQLRTGEEMHCLQPRMMMKKRESLVELLLRPQPRWK